MNPLVNITSMVYIKECSLVGWSGTYNDYTVTKDGIFVLNPGRYRFNLYGPLHIAVQTRSSQYLLKDTLIIELEQYDLVRLLHLEHKREFYETVVLLSRIDT